MRDGRDRKYMVDREGRTWITDSEGRPVTDSIGNRIPGPAERLTTSGFTHYDDSRGHCGLCGSLTCRGTCFK